MSDQIKDENDLVAEFKQLTQNLRTAMQAAWERPGRRQLQEDLKDGLEDMRQTFDQLASDFSKSQTGQQLKSDVEELGDRVKSGELESQVRAELVTLLQRVNKELQAASDRMAETGQSTPDAAPPTGEDAQT